LNFIIAVFLSVFECCEMIRNSLIYKGLLKICVIMLFLMIVRNGYRNGWKMGIEMGGFLRTKQRRGCYPSPLIPLKQ
jgi:hypothetical protein